MRRNGIIWLVCSCLTILVLTGLEETRAGNYVTPPIMQYGLGKLICVAYSPDGHTILTAGGGGLNLAREQNAGGGTRLRPRPVFSL